MARPAILKDLPPTTRVCGWVNGRGHRRGLYAQARGQFVQARISGYAMAPRDFIAADWISLGLIIQSVVTGWSSTWRLEGIRVGTVYGTRNPRGLLAEKRA